MLTRFNDRCISPRSLRVATVALAALLVMLVPARTRAAGFFQGFEVDTSGWFPGDGTANREANGYVSPVPYASGITSSAGTHHARLRRETCGTESTGGGPAVYCTGAYTLWGGYNKDWTGGYTTQVDVYFDVAYAIANPDTPSGNIACLTADPSDTTCNGTRFDFSSAIGDSSGGFLRDFVFNVGTGPDSPPTCPGGQGFVISASTNAFRSGANPYNPGKAPFCISTSGWYTLRHTFTDVAGFLVVNMDLLQGNTVVNSWSIASGDPISTVGCNQYGWFANEEIWDLAIDNSQMTGCGVEVTQCSLDGWEIVNFDQTLGTDVGDATTASGTDGDFVSGPAAPPLGSGSLQQVVGTSGNPASGDDATRIRTNNCNGMLLSDVANLPVWYWTYVSSFGSGGQATYIQLRIDLDGDGAFDDALFFEPVYQNGTYGMITGPAVPNQCTLDPNCVVLNTWQFWDASEGGWWSNIESAGGPPLITLANYSAEHPGAKVATDTPSLRLQAGFGGAAWAGFNGATDDLTACGTTYNFESGACPTTTPTPGAATPTATPTPTATMTPGCGNGIIDPGETCDPPGSPAGPNGNLCRANCTVCGDGIIQAGEQCDDGNSAECDPLHPQKPVAGDSCNNVCTGLICKDPSSIKLTSGLDRFKSHGVIVPMAGAPIDFSGGDVTISLTTGQTLVFESSVPNGAVGALTNGGFKYKDRDAKLAGGIYELKATPTRDGTFKLTIISYGDLSQATSDMVTHIIVAGHEWTVHGQWRKTGSGWVFDRAIP